MTIDLNTFYGLLATQKLGFFLFAAGIFFALLLILVLFYKAGKWAGSLQASQNRETELRAARDDALKRSRAVLKGMVGEQMAPFLPHFPCPPEDCCFIGKPVDFIAFCGSDSDSIDEIVFIEVKTAGSVLSKRERAVKEAIEKKRIRYVEYRIRD